MSPTPLAEDPSEILVGRIIDGTLPATPEGIASVAWVCDFVATEPNFVTLTSTSDGQVFSQQSGDSGANAWIGPTDRFFSAPFDSPAAPAPALPLLISRWKKF